MANSGIKKVTKLRKYINGNPTKEVKDNVITDSDYIPNYISKRECPTGCDAIVSGGILINANSSGTPVFSFSTTTSSTTTTTQAPEPGLAVRDYRVINTGTNEPVVIQYKDEFGQLRTETVQPLSPLSITASSEPYRLSGGTSVTIAADSPVYEASTTTTTKILKTTDDYIIDNSNGTETVIVQLTQIGSTDPIETEIKPGKIVKVSSDDTVTRVSGSTDAVITQANTSVTPTETEYTITNNSFYEADRVEYRPYGGVTDERELSPGETILIKSQDPPKTANETPFDTFSGDGINDTFQLATEPKNQNNIQVYVDDEFQGVEEYDITGTDLTFNTPPAANSTIEVTETKISVGINAPAEQPEETATIEERICNQHVLYNDSEYVATFNYIDCNKEPSKVILEPNQSTTVTAIAEPTLVQEESPSVGTSFAVETIENPVGTSGSATAVIPPTPEPTPEPEPAPEPEPEAPNTQQEVVATINPDFPSGEPQHVRFNPTSSHTQSLWWPKTVRIPMDKKKGEFQFISYDSGWAGQIYRVIDGNTTLLDTSILDVEMRNGFYQQLFRTAFIGQLINDPIRQAKFGLGSDVNAIAELYAGDNGAKRTQPRKLGKVKKKIIGWKQLYNPFNQTYYTAFTLNKVTTNDYVTVEIYQSHHWGDANGSNSATTYGARFEVTGLKN